MSNQLENTICQGKVRYHSQTWWHIPNQGETRKLLSTQVPIKVYHQTSANQSQSLKIKKLSQKKLKCICSNI